MRSRTGRLVVTIAALTAVAIGGVTSAQPVDPLPWVTGAVQVSGNPIPVRAHSSPQLARNPATGELVLVESDVRGARTCDIHISVDEGRSWFAGGGIMMDPYVDCSFFAEYGAYATLTFANDGTLYVAFVASEMLDRERDVTPRHVFLARSEDGGRTFQTTMVFEAPDGNPDRGLNKGPMLAVHPGDPDAVYVGWRQGVFRAAKEKLKSNVAASTDGGRTFSPPVDITDERGGDYPQLAVDRQGTLHAVYWTRVWPPTEAGEQAPVRPIMYARSTDGGRTFTTPREIDPGNRAASRPAALAADPSSGNLYLVWHGHDDVENTGPDFTGDLDIFVRSSTDGGDTWSDRVVVNDDDAGANQYEPGIAIAPNGRVDVAWYDFRHDPAASMTSTGHSGDTGLSDVYYSWSSDGGRTFARNVRVTDRSIDRSRGVWSNNIDSKFNVGIASTDDAVFLAWQDTRNAIGSSDAEDVYAATVRFDAATVAAVSSSSGVAWWGLLGAGFALGLGVAAIGGWAVIRRSTITAAVGHRAREGSRLERA